jgi:hypothetical protein
MCDKCIIDQEIDTDRKSTENQSSSEIKNYKNNKLENHHWVEKLKAKIENLENSFYSIPPEQVLEDSSDIYSLVGEIELLPDKFYTHGFRARWFEIQNRIKKLMELDVYFEEVGCMRYGEMIYDGKKFVKDLEPKKGLSKNENKT